MRRTLLFTLMSVSLLGCADADAPLEGAGETSNLAFEGPWIDDPITPPKSDDDAAKPGLGDAGSEHSDPWLDPPLTEPGSSAPSSGARYDFEGSTDGWTRSGPPIAGVALSGAQHVSGRESLAVEVDGAGTALVSVANPRIRPGAVVTFHLFVPAGAKLAWVQPYVQQDQTANWLWTGNWQQASALQPNAWNTLKVIAPSNARRFAFMGVQLSTSSAWRGRVYIDAIEF